MYCSITINGKARCQPYLAVGCADEGGASIATDALRKKTISTSYAGY